MNAPAKRQRRRVDGVLLLDKPGGMTSNAALQKARRLLNAAKAGHTGTLDPMATGLLSLCFGEATKFAGTLLTADKRYEAAIRFGVRTDTGDAEGRALERRPVAATREQVEAVLARFTGDIMQVPPMHSALKRDGRPLYEYARKGIELERQPRPVAIHSIELISFGGDLVEIAVDCSKGTYIRTLAQDIGEALGCGGHLEALRRTRIGPLRIETAVTLDALEALPPEARDAGLQPADALLDGLPRTDLDAAAAERFGHGQRVAGETGQDEGLVRVYAGERFMGLGRRLGDGHIAPERLMATGIEK